MATCETADSVDETAAGVTGRLWEAVDLVTRPGAYEQMAERVA